MGWNVGKKFATEKTLSSSTDLSTNSHSNIIKTLIFLKYMFLGIVGNALSKNQTELKYL